MGEEMNVGDYLESHLWTVILQNNGDLVLRDGVFDSTCKSDLHRLWGYSSSPDFKLKF